MFAATGFRLGKRELEIMNVVWDSGEATVQDVCDRLARPAAYCTVLTMMRTLETKGMLTHRVDGRTFVYRPHVPRERVRASLVHELRELVFDGSATLLVNTMLNHGTMNVADLSELRRLLAQTEMAAVRGRAESARLHAEFTPLQSE